MFRFHDPGRLVDDDLELVLVEKYHGDPTIKHVPAYRFSMRLVEEGVEVGRIELRLGQTRALIHYAGQLDFEVYPAYRGRRYAVRACKLLLPLAHYHKFKTLWITCDPENMAARRTCELLGAKLVEIVDLPKDLDMYKKGARQRCRYRLDL